MSPILGFLEYSFLLFYHNFATTWLCERVLTPTPLQGAITEHANRGLPSVFSVELFARKYHQVTQLCYI